jgi:hypothetical protein
MGDSLNLIILKNEQKDEGKTCAYSNRKFEP